MRLSLKNRMAEVQSQYIKGKLVKLASSYWFPRIVLKLRMQNYILFCHQIILVSASLFHLISRFCFLVGWFFSVLTLSSNASVSHSLNFSVWSVSVLFLSEFYRQLVERIYNCSALNKLRCRSPKRKLH